MFSELVLCGYPPEDLLLREGFLAAHDRALQDLAASLSPDLPCLIGCVERNPDAAAAGGRSLFNAAALCEDGIARTVARKVLLPTYDVFDEHRYFEPWSEPESNVLRIAGRRVGVTICVDAWNDAAFVAERHYRIDPVARIAEQGVDMLVNLSASPWNRGATSEDGKERFRYRMMRAASERHRVPFLFVNQAGGNVGMQFDGGSMAISPRGLAMQPRSFAEAVQVVDLEQDWRLEPRWEPLVAMQHGAIVQGIRDYVTKFGLGSAIIGLSGGIDSAVTAALAVDALGPDLVTGIAMPSTFSSDHSLRDARELAVRLGIRCPVVPIAGLQAAFGHALAELFEGTEPGIAEENLQARARGAVLMAYANKFGGIVLTTGNKSEAAVGYCTLYGDTNGALAPIADLWKTEVRELAHWINRDGLRIPSASIDKPPSAELRPDQLDSDSLPPYERLDPMLRLLIEDDLPVPVVAARCGEPVEVVAAMFRLVARSEYKRFQYPPTIRVSSRCWGGRRMPATHGFVVE